ncbi:hypothetical protein ARZXY2_2942 [Arthrobacter sp. ZXY-2]|nr:hypothetical protein ARZXY2_2942 [Arthrobacter sp. ZXY-2]
MPLHCFSWAGWGSCGPIAPPTVPLISAVFWLVFLTGNVRCALISPPGRTPSQAPAASVLTLSSLGAQMDRQAREASRIRSAGCSAAHHTEVAA